MVQPTSAPLRRHFLPGVKVEYSVSPRQSSYRIQIHRIQVGQDEYKQNIYICQLLVFASFRNQQQDLFIYESITFFIDWL